MTWIVAFSDFLVSVAFRFVSLVCMYTHLCRHIKHLLYVYLKHVFLQTKHTNKYKNIK